MIRIFTPSDRKLVKSLTLSLVLATAALAGQAVQGESLAAESGVNAGLLTCHSLPNTRTNWILYSSVRVFG